MAEVMNMAVESLDRPDGGSKEDPSTEDPQSSSPPQPPPPPAPPSANPPNAPGRRRDRDSRERRDDRGGGGGGELNRRGGGGDYYRDRDRDYKRRNSMSPPPLPYRDRSRHSPPPPRRSPPYKRSRRDDGGYEGRRGSPRPGFGPPDRGFGYDYGGGYDRPPYPDERPPGRYGGRRGGYQNGPSDWDSGRGGYGDASNAGSNQREGLMSYKQFIQELEDDVLPAEAERRYQEYKSEYISTQKRVFFEAHKDEEWMKDKYHPTNLLPAIERRNDHARKVAKDFVLDLQSGTLDLGPGFNASSSNKSGQTSEPNSEDEGEAGGKRRRHGRSTAKESDMSAAPKAHPVSSEARRIQLDIEQCQSLVRKLDSEKGIEENVLCGSENDKMSREKGHGTSTGPVIIIRGLTSVKGLEGVELLDTLITYLWRIHGLDYYGMIETSEPKGLRHVRAEGKTSDISNNGTEWEKKLDFRWQERLRGQDPLEIMAAKEKIDAAALESMDPYVRKIRDEKYGWKYGCGAKGCTKLFHASEFVQKHLKLKHPEVVMEVTVKVREELYFQNYMNDESAPGSQPVMQQKDMRRRLGPDNRKDERGNRRERDNRPNISDRLDRSENQQSGDFQSNTDGPDGGNHDEQMFDTFGGQGIHMQSSFPSDIPPPPVLMPVPGAGPLGPFVPAPPEVAMQMFREQGGPPQFEGGGRGGRPGPQLSGPGPILLSSSFRQDPRRIRSYQDLDAPEDEVTVIDYRSL